MGASVVNDAGPAANLSAGIHGYDQARVVAVIAREMQ
jgi:hypothetical protein